MIYRIHTPAFPLSQFIGHFFYYEGYHATHRMDKFLPDGSVDLLIDLTESPKKLFHNEEGNSYTTFSRSWISGMKTEYILIDSSVTNMLGVHFKPGGLYPFVDVPVSELNDMTISSDLVWGSSINTIREAILHETVIEKRFEIIENFMIETGKRKMDLHQLVNFSINSLLADPQVGTIGDLSRRTGITQKHLISLFRKYVGLAPKMFARISKFQKVVQLVERQQKIDWTSLAYECGYYDQAHFIKEFRSFSGINPSAYLAQRGEFINYIPQGTG